MMKSLAGALLTVFLSIPLLIGGCTPQNAGGSSVSLKDLIAEMPPETVREMMANIIDSDIPDEIQRNGSRNVGAYNLALISDSTFFALLSWLEQQAAKFPPEYFYLIAQRLQKSDGDKAKLWWLTGRLRLMYDVARCTDKSTQALVRRSDFELHRSASTRGLAPLKASVDDLQMALDWDMKLPPHKFPVLPTCLSGMEAIGLGLKFSDLAQERPFGDKSMGERVPGHAGKVITLPAVGVTDKARWLKPESEYSYLLEKVRDEYRSLIEKGLRQRGQRQL